MNERADIYYKLREMYGMAPPDEKIQILRHEVMRTQSMALGFANLLLDEMKGDNDASQELIEWIQKIIKYSQETLEIVWSLSDQ